jgi:ABC-type protease/lipase transport system fused ATPase/permease subunit
MAAADKMLVLENGSVSRFGSRAEIMDAVQGNTVEERRRRIRAVTAEVAENG